MLDRERPDVDSKLGGNRQRLDRRESAIAFGNVKRFRLSRASPLTAGTIRLVLAIGSTTTARSAASTARGASRSFCSGPRRPRWCASRRPSGASCASPSRVRLSASRRLRAAVCARPSNSACCRASGVDAAFVALGCTRSARSRRHARSSTVWRSATPSSSSSAITSRTRAAMRAAALRARSGRGRRLTMRACST